jgi:protein-L-isoaspartate(D-aspartate) O-methyltransferase
VSDIQAAREQYAADLQAAVAMRSAALRQAFARVPREHYLGAGPWKIFSMADWRYHETPDADPVHLYRDVLIGIDPDRLLNNGQPSSHAMWMDALDPHADEHVVHVGTGVGYYTAILADVVGAGGRVTGIELDPRLAARARQNLAHLPWVQVIEGNGTTYDPGDADAIYINAGATHVVRLWLDRLRPGGRLVVPLVRWPTDPSEARASGSGVVLCVSRQGEDWSARIVSVVGIFPCVGAVDAAADRALADALARGTDSGATFAVRRDPQPRDDRCWLHGDGICFRHG